MTNNLNLKFILNLFFSYFLNNLQEIHWKLIYFLIWWDKKLLNVVNFKIILKKKKNSIYFFYYLRYFFLFNQENFLNLYFIRENEISDFFLYNILLNSFKFLN